MKSRFITDPLDSNADPDGSDFNFGAVLATHSSPAPVSASHMLPAVTPVAPVLPDESMEAMAAVSGSGSGGTGAVIAETSSSGFTINLVFDAAAMAAPASFRTGIEQAAAILSATITNKITVNINIDYSGTGGGAAAGPDGGQFVNYSTVRSDLIANAAPGDTSFNALPNSTSIGGQSQIAVWNAQLKLFGLLGPNSTTTDDASATFATDINPNLLVGVALHELTHAMGRVPYGPQPDIFDFYRFTSPGNYLFTDNIPASSAYFSLNGGITKLADFGVSSDPSDFLNSGVQGGNDPFNEFYSGSTLQSLTSTDKQILDALGFNTVSSIIVIESFGVTSLEQVGSNYYLDPVAGGTGPELKSGGVAVVAGQFGSVLPIGAEQTATGYDVAWQVTGTNQFEVWSTDTSGNFTANLTGGGLVSGNSSVLESLETTFHQDLNGDGVIGVAAATNVVVANLEGAPALLVSPETFPSSNAFAFREYIGESPAISNTGGASVLALSNHLPVVSSSGVEQPSNVFELIHSGSQIDGAQDESAHLAGVMSSHFLLY